MKWNEKYWVNSVKIENEQYKSMFQAGYKRQFSEWESNF